MDNYEINFWNNVVKANDTININGCAYTPDGFKEEGGEGFGGETFYILVGKTLVLTNDLWYRGEIPMEYQEKLTKGKFIEEDEFNRLKAQGYQVVNKLE